MASGSQKTVPHFHDVYEEGPRKIHIISEGRYFHPETSYNQVYSQSSSTTNVSVVREQYCLCTKNQTPRERRLLIACIIFLGIILGLVITLIIILTTNEDAARRMKKIFDPR